ncbi:hypothetical protein KGP93_08620 [Burkholderia multivorans]|nr:hypothetical protein [Burkholderia multivorans]
MKAMIERYFEWFSAGWIDKISLPSHIGNLSGKRIGRAVRNPRNDKFAFEVVVAFTPAGNTTPHDFSCFRHEIAVPP